MKQALIVIDVQRDYFPGGKCELVGTKQALSQVNKMEKYFLTNNLPIIYIQHIKEDENADFFAQNSRGVELHPALSLDEDSIVITKRFPNSFLETSLERLLEDLEVNQLVVVGMMTHMCVDSTVRAAKEKGYNPILISDATATKNLLYSEAWVGASDVQRSFLAALRNFASIMTVDRYFSL